MTEKKRALRIGTRGSLLARAQTEWVARRLSEQHPGLKFEIVVIRTFGDKHADTDISRSLGKGFFTKEIEDALLAEDVDVAIHSLKDLPVELSEGLLLAAVTDREDPRDALLGRRRRDLREQSAEPPTVGTSSPRRAAQLRRLFPRVHVRDLRGNIDTRLRKVKEGTVDCAVVAVAGLRRIGRDAEISDVFSVREMAPAPGQGALAMEIRGDDIRTRRIVAALHCEDTARCVMAERAFLRKLGGGCRVPVGALGAIARGTLRLRGRVISLDGARMFEHARSGRPDEAERIGCDLADVLLERGAGEIITAYE